MTYDDPSFFFTPADDMLFRPKQKPQKLSDIPLQKSSTNLTNNMKYEKSVDTMLSEASQMRADLAAKRAAKANGDDSDSKRFGKKRQIKY